MRLIKFWFLYKICRPYAIYRLFQDDREKRELIFQAQNLNYMNSMNRKQLQEYLIERRMRERQNDARFLRRTLLIIVYWMLFIVGCLALWMIFGAL